jgi:hypothetical protein
VAQTVAPTAKEPSLTTASGYSLVGEQAKAGTRRPWQRATTFSRGRRMKGIVRYHPSVVAEAFATLNQLRPGRVFLGVGSGEVLNENAAVGNWLA